MRRCFRGRSIDDPSGAVPANTRLCTYPYAPLNTRGAYGGCTDLVFGGVHLDLPKWGAHFWGGDIGGDDVGVIT